MLKKCVIFLCFSSIGDASSCERELQSLVFTEVVLSRHNFIGYTFPSKGIYLYLSVELSNYVICMMYFHTNYPRYRHFFPQSSGMTSEYCAKIIIMFVLFISLLHKILKMNTVEISASCVIYETSVLLKSCVSVLY